MLIQTIGRLCVALSLCVPLSTVSADAQPFRMLDPNECIAMHSTILLGQKLDYERDDSHLFQLRGPEAAALLEDSNIWLEWEFVEGDFRQDVAKTMGFRGDKFWFTSCLTPYRAGADIDCTLVFVREDIEITHPDQSIRVVIEYAGGPGCMSLMEQM